MNAAGGGAGPAEYSEAVAEAGPQYGRGSREDALRPVALLRWTEDGELQLGMFGDGIRMLVIDERVPHDRVYEVTHREQLHALDALIPPGTEVGHADDERHEALVARMTALFNGKPHLRVVSGGADPGGSLA